jgi:ATPase subunit of ABC transporter with duplicated ATPase domains
MFLNRSFRSLVARHALYRPLSVSRGDSVIELHQVTCKLQDGRTLFSDVNVSLLGQTIVGVVGYDFIVESCIGMLV